MPRPGLHFFGVSSPPFLPNNTLTLIISGLVLPHCFRHKRNTLLLYAFPRKIFAVYWEEALFLRCVKAANGQRESLCLVEYPQGSKVRRRMVLKMGREDLLVSAVVWQGYDFRPLKGSSRRWSFLQLKRIDLPA
jgi:hypothetical protein